MAEKKNNIFARIGAYFKSILLELKRVIWPSKEKLKSISAVVFVVIIFFAILLTAISSGAQWGLDKIGFYNQVDPTETTVAETTVAETTAAETTAAETTVAETTEANS